MSSSPGTGGAPGSRSPMTATGMTEAELVTAMTIAAKGPRPRRGPKDLGRFGMGLKTASFSQARQLIVSTAPPGGPRAIRAWDLDVVRRSGEWRLLQEVDAADAAAPGPAVDRAGHGGPVAAPAQVRPRGDHRRRCRSKRHFYEEIRNRVEPHLGMVFSRFLDGKRLNAANRQRTNPVQPWDPFLRNQQFVQQLPAEDIPIGGHLMTVAGFVLPHPRHLSDEAGRCCRRAAWLAGPAGLLRLQARPAYRGRGLARNQRVPQGGQIHPRPHRRRHPRRTGRRVEYRCPQVRHGAAAGSPVPPAADRRRRAAPRRGGAEPPRSIVAREHGADFIYAWKVEQRNGQVTCRINRKHPLVQQVLRGGTDESADANALIRLLEETVPVAALRVMHQAETIDDPEPFMTPRHRRRRGGQGRGTDPGCVHGPGPHACTRPARRIRLMPPFDQIAGFWQNR